VCCATGPAVDSGPGPQHALGLLFLALFLLSATTASQSFRHEEVKRMTGRAPEQQPEPDVETQDAVDNLEVPQFEVMDKGLDPSGIEHRDGCDPN